MLNEKLVVLADALVQEVLEHVTKTLEPLIRKEVAAQLSAQPREPTPALRKPVPRFSGPRRVRIAELEHRLGIHRTTIWRHCRDGRFPMPHYIGEQRAWWLHEIEAWEGKEAHAVPRRQRRTPRQTAK